MPRACQFLVACISWAAHGLGDPEVVKFMGQAFVPAVPMARLASTVQTVGKTPAIPLGAEERVPLANPSAIIRMQQEIAQLKDENLAMKSELQQFKSKIATAATVQSHEQNASADATGPQLAGIFGIAAVVGASIYSIIFKLARSSLSSMRSGNCVGRQLAGLGDATGRIPSQCGVMLSASVPTPAIPLRTIGPTMKLDAGATVTIIGASGNVGKLVALRLANSFKVRGVVREAAKVRGFLPDSVELFEADIFGEGAVEALQPALKDSAAVVVCTGTTAFPTKAWSQDGSGEVTGDVVQALFNTRFSIADAISSLDAKGLNTPRNVDDIGTRNVLKAWEKAAGGARRRFVLMSSIGVQRRDQMPFPILNACGVLDAKAAGEAELKAAAAAGGFSFTVVRPGQLFGGPYDNNYYLGTLFQLDKDAATQDIKLASGDTLVGDTLRSTLAEVIAQCLETDTANNMDFSIVNEKGTPPEVDVLQQRLGGLA